MADRYSKLYWSQVVKHLTELTNDHCRILDTAERQQNETFIRLELNFLAKYNKTHLIPDTVLAVLVLENITSE